MIPKSMVDTTLDCVDVVGRVPDQGLLLGQMASLNGLKPTFVTTLEQPFDNIALISGWAKAFECSLDLVREVLEFVAKEDQAAVNGHLLYSLTSEARLLDLFNLGFDDLNELI